MTQVKFYQVNPSLDYPLGAIGADAHGLNWRIDMADDYSGWIIMNNAGGWFKVSDLENALRIVRENSIVDEMANQKGSRR